MRFTETPLKGSYLIDLELKGDERGFFARLFCEKEFALQSLNTHWVQINNSYTNVKGTVRGLHFQYPPYMEVKMVRCTKGQIWDVVIDIRKDSETFGKSFSCELSEINRRMLYIPVGFAHGFQTMSDDVELLYFHSCHFSKSHEGGINPIDPTFGINWPLPVHNLSDRDSSHPFLTESFKGI
jgi:dTDP-4-dehydrorhamnose 3,5-epimerase